MPLLNRKNFAVSSVLTAPSPATSGTSLTIQSGEGTLFPAAPFLAVVCPASTAPTAANAEVVYVSAKTTDTFTIQRAYDGSTARSIVVGDQIYVSLVDGYLTDLFADLTGITNTTANSGYPTGAYALNATTTDGFTTNGRLTGAKNGTLNAQRLQDWATGATYARYWIDGSTAWSAWSVYLDAQDYTAKGQAHFASASNTAGVLTVGTNDSILQADSVEVLGVKWNTSLQLASIAEPAAPAAGKLLLYAGTRAGRVLARIKGPSGIDIPLQPHLYANSLVMASPGGGTALTNIGATFTISGTASHPAPASTNFLNQMKKTVFKSGTGSNASNGVYTGVAQFWRGNATDLGGWFYYCRFNIGGATLGSAPAAGGRGFIGLTSLLTAVLAVNTNPSALTTNVGIGLLCDAADTVWSYYTRVDGTTFTKTATSLSKSGTDVLDFWMFAPPNGSNVTLRLVNATSNTVILDDVVVSANLPPATTFLGVQAAYTAGSSGVAQILALNKLYCDSDN